MGQFYKVVECYKRRNHWYSTEYDGGFELCHNELGDYFSVVKSVDLIYVTLSSTPLLGGYKVEMLRGGTICIYGEQGRKHYEYIAHRTQFWLDLWNIPVRVPFYVNITEEKPL